MCVHFCTSGQRYTFSGRQLDERDERNSTKNSIVTLHECFEETSKVFRPIAICVCYLRSVHGFWWRAVKNCLAIECCINSGPRVKRLKNMTIVESRLFPFNWKTVNVLVFLALHRTAAHATQWPGQKLGTFNEHIARMSRKVNTERRRRRRRKSEYMARLLLLWKILCH